MAIKLKHSDTFSTYFITFTCAEWIPLFEITHTYDMVYKWFAVLKKDHHADVVAYVIMPNHPHVILHFHKEGFNLNTILANGKRFIAYEIINRLEKKKMQSCCIVWKAWLLKGKEKKDSCIKFSKTHLMPKQSSLNIFYCRKLITSITTL